MQKAQLMTRWAKDVKPDHPRPEYPRPQMVRKEWLNLNGLWEFVPAKENDPPPAGKELSEKILVPFPVESALSGIMKRHERVWYRRTFTVPKSWEGKKILLHFGAVNWEAGVYLDGETLGTHRGGYDRFSFDVTDVLRKPLRNELRNKLRNDEHELLISAYNPADSGGQPRGKQVNKPGSIWYLPSTGIWQTVWLEPVPENAIETFKLTPDVDAGVLRVVVKMFKQEPELQIRAVAYDNGKVAGKTGGKAEDTLTIPIPNPKLWSPEDPFLYDLKILLIKNNKELDAVSSYFGMRKIEIKKDEKGFNRIFLNGKFAFQVGPLDQGYWPDGLYTPPTEDAMKFDIEVTKKLGFNMSRKHVKVEPERWYYWCDKLGLLVWQDMPSGNNKTEEDKKQFEVELRELVEEKYNYPSIIMWVVFNEGWGQFDTARLTQFVRQIDPARLINSASGWWDQGTGDILDVHSYPAPAGRKPIANRASVVGEFGGIGLAVQEHTWSGEQWSYKDAMSFEALTAEYEELMKQMQQLKDSHGMSASVYTQITDTETETNGLLTYDREILKVDAKKVLTVNQELVENKRNP